MDSSDDHPYSRSRRLLPGPASSSPSTAPSKDANPATELLQDMIREKRAQTQRVKKTYDPGTRTAGGEMHDSAHQGSQSSPSTVASPRGRPSFGARRVSGANGKPTVQKEMGLREMSEHISKVDKQNFDLKLEVFHRRQRNEVLEAKVNELEARETDYESLQTKFEALLLESDRQRLILEDAVAQICELQSENEELQAMLGAHYAGLSGFESVGTGKNRETSADACLTMPASPLQGTGRSTRPQSPDRQSSVKRIRSTASRRHLNATPPVREGNPNAASLYSFYASGDRHDHRNPSLLSVNRPESLFSGDDEDASERQMFNSPRLSILSESGFSSIYGSPSDNIPASSLADNDKNDSVPSSRTESDPSQRSAHNARIDLWIQEKPKPATPVAPSPNAGVRERFTSIEQVLHKLPDVPNEDSKRPDEVHIPQRQSSTAVRAFDSPRPRKMRSSSKTSTQRGRSLSSSNCSMTFGGKLPPTPDTMSTATIGGPNSSTQSIITEKSLIDHSQPHGKGYANLIAYGRPHTSESDSPRSHNPTHSGLNGLGFDDKFGFKQSHEDDEVRSTVVEQGDREISTSSSLMGGMAHQSGLPGFTSQIRPSMTTHQTDMFFNEGGFALVQPSRTFSYPAAGRSSKQSSAPLSPRSHRSERSQNSSNVSDRVHQPLSPKKPSKVTHVTTPTKTSPNDVRSSLPAKQSLDRSSSPTNPAKQDINEPTVVLRPKSGRFAFFKRSNPQNVNKSLNAAPWTSMPQPHTNRSMASRQSQSVVPEPESFISARPGTSDGSTPAVNARSSRPPRRHSAILDHATSFIPRATASSDHSRRLSESRQTFRTEDSKSRWPLGRSASAKIKEGLGLRRSQVS